MAEDSKNIDKISKIYGCKNQELISKLYLEVYYNELLLSKLCDYFMLMKKLLTLIGMNNALFLFLSKDRAYFHVKQENHHFLPRLVATLPTFCDKTQTAHKILSQSK